MLIANLRYEIMFLVKSFSKFFVCSILCVLIYSCSSSHDKENQDSKKDSSDESKKEDSDTDTDVDLVDVDKETADIDSTKMQLEKKQDDKKISTKDSQSDELDKPKPYYDFSQKGFSLADIMAQPAICREDEQIDSLKVYVPFLDVSVGDVIETDGITIEFTAVKDPMFVLADDFVMPKSQKIAKGEFLVNVGNYQKTTADIKYILVSKRTEFTAKFKYHDKIFTNGTLKNDFAKKFLVYYELVRSFFKTEGPFKLDVNEKTFSASSDISFFKTEFTEFKELISEKDQETQDISTSSFENVTKYEVGDDVSYQVKLISVYYMLHDDLVSNQVYVKNSSECEDAKQDESADDGESSLDEKSESKKLDASDQSQTPKESSSDSDTDDSDEQ